MQARSKAMVEALLDATARILVKDGWDALSTNRVAALAGVSVGSLYQYFPSREALVHAVIERWTTTFAADMTALAEKLGKASLQRGVPIVVRAALDSARVDTKLHRAFLENLPRLGRFEAFEQLNRRLAELLAGWLGLHERRLGVDDPALAAWVVVQLLSGLIDQALLYRPELLQLPRFQRHLERLVLNYLSGERAGSRG
ncbi:MAG: TetR/AcrR family transcriptional regulator [Myxococcota bacterium]